MMFIENVGQFDDKARFQVQGGNGTMWLADDALWITLLAPTDPPSDMPDGFPHGPNTDDTHETQPQLGVNIKLSFVGANTTPQLEPFGRLETSVNYFTGDDPDNWHTDVLAWSGVRYVELYPDVDLEITGETGQLLLTLVCDTNCQSALQQVRLRVDGAEVLRLAEEQLVLITPVGDFVLPSIGFVTDGATPTALNLMPHLEKNTIFFSSPATHSPQLEELVEQDNLAGLLYGTYLGGGGIDMGLDTVVDGTGNTYITGRTDSTNFPTTPGTFDPTHNGYWDAFVVKLNPAGNSLAYATFLGGNDGDYGVSIVIDATGNAYVTGDTSSTNFPVTTGSFDPTLNGGNDAFVVKLNPTGNGLAYATFLGGTAVDMGNGIAVDGTGNAYVVGLTYSPDFPTTPTSFDSTYNYLGDAFVVKLNPAGSGLAYATFIGGNNIDLGNGIAIDVTGNVYIVGDTYSANFPTTTGAFDETHNGGDSDAFLLKLSHTGGSLTYATFLGGNAQDAGRAIALDGGGNAYVTGDTGSANFPTTSGVVDQTYNGGNNDAFVVKFTPTGSNIAYATFLGGNSQDVGKGIAVDGARNVYVVGDTRSANFPTTPGAFDRTHNIGHDIFVVKLNPIGSSLTYATFLGGTDASEDFGNSIAIDGADNAFIVGETDSAHFPTSPGAFDNTNNGYNDAFVVKLELIGGCNFSRQPLLFVTGWNGSAAITSGEYDSQLSYFFGANGYLASYGYAEGCNLFYATATSPYLWLSQNGRVIRDNLCIASAQIKAFNPTWNGHFDIIAHSYGGLRARAYLEDESLYGQNCPGSQTRVIVDNLFTLGTPHAGEPHFMPLPLATVIGMVATGTGQLPALGEMLPPVRLVQNLASSQPANVCYHLLAGDARSQWPIILGVSSFGQWLGPYGPYVLSVPNDLAVHRASAHVLGSSIYNWQYDDVHLVSTPDLHGQIPVTANLLRSFVNPNTTFTTEIWPYIGSHSCPTTQVAFPLNGSALTATELLTEQRHPSNSPVMPMMEIDAGQLSGNQTVNGQFALNGTGSSQISLSWQQGDISISMIDPDGNPINSGTVGSNPNIDLVTLDTGFGVISTYVITDTLNGTWQYTLTADNIDPATGYRLFAIPPLPVAASVSLPQWLPNQSPVVITATVSFDGSTPVIGGTVNAQVHLPTGSSQTLDLFDDGAHSDGQPDDGVFGNTYTQTGEGGIYGVVVTANGVYAGEPYTRTAIGYFTIAPDTASLTGQYSDTPIDTDGDPAYEWLEINIGVNVTVPGTYTLSADLYAGNTFITHARTKQFLSNGSQTVAIRFDGVDIYNHQLNGPYTVRNVLLLDESSVTLLIEAVGNAHTTAPYNYTDFDNGINYIYLPMVRRP